VSFWSCYSSTLTPEDQHTFHRTSQSQSLRRRAQGCKAFVSNKALTVTIKTTYTAFGLYLIAFDLRKVSYRRSHSADHSCVPFSPCMYLLRDQFRKVMNSSACDLQQPARERCESRGGLPALTGLESRRSRVDDEDDSASRRGARG
jgi:hypothetical protein